MKTDRCKTGLTLVELLIAVAVVVILISITIVAGNSLRAQAEARLAAGTISILVTALEQYYEFHDEFPLDCTNYAGDVLAQTLRGPDAAIGGPGIYDPYFASSSALYYYLSTTPSSKSILESINESLITCEGLNNSGSLKLITPEERINLLRVIDPWGNPLRYRYTEGWNFPLITSDGPDGKFNTEWDNITSKGR